MARRKTLTEPEQSQGGHGWPGRHAAQVHEEVLPPPLPRVPPLETLPGATQSQAQGGQAWPGAQTGLAQAQVPVSRQPPSLTGGAQSQSQGAQASPGRHEAQAQVHTPVPVPTEPPQSHSIGGQVAPAGQYAGLTHAHEEPSGALA